MLRPLILFAKVMLAVPAAPLRAALTIIVPLAQLATPITASAQYQTARFVQTGGNVTTTVSVLTIPELLVQLIYVLLSLLATLTQMVL
jgi:hypothetical protein